MKHNDGLHWVRNGERRYKVYCHSRYLQFFTCRRAAEEYIDLLRGLQQAYDLFYSKLEPTGASSL